MVGTCATLSDRAGYRIVDLRQIGNVNQAGAGEQWSKDRGLGNTDHPAQPLPAPPLHWPVDWTGTLPSSG